MQRDGQARGTLELAEDQVRAGKRLTVEPFEVEPVLSSVDPLSVASWREGRLEYIDEPLDGVLADLARYSPRRIVIEDHEIGNLRVTGIVFVQSIDSWLASLQATFPIRVITNPDGSVIIEKR